MSDQDGVKDDVKNDRDNFNIIIGAMSKFIKNDVEESASIDKLFDFVINMKKDMNKKTENLITEDECQKITGDVKKLKDGDSSVLPDVFCFAENIKVKQDLIMEDMIKNVGNFVFENSPMFKQILVLPEKIVDTK